MSPLQNFYEKQPKQPSRHDDIRLDYRDLPPFFFINKRPSLIAKHSPINGEAHSSIALAKGQTIAPYESANDSTHRLLAPILLKIQF